MSRLRSLSILLLGATLGAATPEARAEDYALADAPWNGVGYLLVTAEEAKVDLRPVDVLDLSRLRSGDVVLWLAPEGPLPVDDLLAFVRDGGFLVVADDRGHADALFEAAGIESRPDGPTDHGAWYEGQEGIPLLRPLGEHFLYFNVDEIAANYPVALTGAGEPVLSFDAPGEALVVERRLGAGALLAIGDPSLFLNEMLRRFYGNKQLAANIMRLYCEGASCEVDLLLPGATVVGRYRSGPGHLGRLPRVFEEAAAFLDALLAGVNDRLGLPPWLYLLAACLLALAALALAQAVRPGRRVAIRPPLGKPSGGESPVRQESRGLAGGHEEADFGASARVLVDEVLRIGRAAGIPNLLREEVESLDLRPEDATVVRNSLLRIRREAASLQRTVPAVISAERFLRLLGDVRTVTRHLEPRGHGARRTR